MRNRLAWLIGAAVLNPMAALSQGPIDPDMLAKGHALFQTNCMVCHKAEGEGRPPLFPALKGNQNLSDPYLIVHNVHHGQNNMPPFAVLTDAEIAAVATYVRNAWDNTFGGVTVEEVTEMRADLDPTGPVRSIWDGVYTQAQADRGKSVFGSPCGTCHGKRLNGVAEDMDMASAPPLAREKFLRVWDGRSLGILFSYAKSTMPQSNPGFLPDEDYVAMIAYMLETSGAPPGTTELPVDVEGMGRIVISPKS
ncbi:c-type cytochrome [Paracoccaceae bacterium Fryx2]|nr:c-type cytochrome [Paracoccaceae bacterium Fryx2]